LGERLLCKQEVVGSIPSASMACALAWPVLWHGLCFGVCAGAVGRVVTEEMGRFGLHGVASPPLGGAGRVRLVGCVFFMDCESGSGASLDAQDVSAGFGGFVLLVGGGAVRG